MRADVLTFKVEDFVDDAEVGPVGLAWSADFESQLTGAPRCPNCGVVGDDNLELGDEDALVQLAGDPSLLVEGTAFCSSCAHMFPAADAMPSLGRPFNPDRKPDKWVTREQARTIAEALGLELREW